MEIAYSIHFFRIVGEEVDDAPTIAANGNGTLYNDRHRAHTNITIIRIAYCIHSVHCTEKCIVYNEDHIIQRRQRRRHSFQKL